MTPHTLDIIGDCILIGSALAICVPPVWLIRALYLQQRRALIERREK